MSRKLKSANESFLRDISRGKIKKIETTSDVEGKSQLQRMAEEERKLRSGVTITSKEKEERER